MFAKLGYRIIELSALEDAAALRAELHGVTSVLVGQSGMGKSTLVNALIPEANAATREISQALDSGKHTTTHATLYHLNADSELIDSPGLQEFGLGHLDRQEIEHAFREFRPYLGQCRFRDCKHNREPDCALIAAVNAGEVDEKRFGAYHRILGTLRPTS
jgi:ribosome biogenesis GTPase / thiamine phosphate phosphatase